MTIAEAIKLKQDLITVPSASRPLPDVFHARTGHSFPHSASKVFQQLEKTYFYAEQNEMRINFSKTKLMLFNPSRTLDFMPDFNLDGHQIELVSHTKLLGLHISDNMKWKNNTENMIKKASKRLWILRRLRSLGARSNSLLDVYVKQVRSILEFGAPVWQGGITVEERQDIERIQKCALNIILGRSYINYNNALKVLNLEELDTRRVKLSLNFALKAEKDPKFKHWFKKPKKHYNTRNTTKYCDIYANNSRYAQSPLGYLTRLLNLHYRAK